MQRTALVVGVTGIGGNHAARELLANGWNVVGLSRGAPRDLPGVRHVAADAGYADHQCGSLHVIPLAFL